MINPGIRVAGGVEYFTKVELVGTAGRIAVSGSGETDPDGRVSDEYLDNILSDDTNFNKVLMAVIAKLGESNEEADADSDATDSE